MLLPLIARLFARSWSRRLPERTRVEQVIHDKLVRQAKAQNIPLRRFSFSALEELRARRAAGFPELWLIDVPTGAVLAEYLRRDREDWKARGDSGSRG